MSDDSEAEGRKLTLDLDLVARAVDALPDPNAAELERADRARSLLDAVISGDTGRGIGTYVLGITDQTFDDARDVIAGGEGRPALQAAAEDLDPEAFDAGQTELYRLRALPDPFSSSADGSGFV